METTRQPVANLKISEDVIATIARVAALEIEGVASLAEPASGRFFPRGFGRKPIHIELSDDFVEIRLSLSLEFGAKIGDVCRSVQQNVKENVQVMTGRAVSKVNVMVSGIVFPKEEKGAE